MAAWLVLMIFFSATLYACAGPQVGETVLSKPDEYSRLFEAKEKLVLEATAQVFREKSLGRNVRIDFRKQTVESDYIVQDDWRTKGLARVKRINWKECEVRLTVITEKQTKADWELRRLLEEEQYNRIFSLIELKIYQEMYKSE